jgi:4-amino-4-deoxy-L-arabinose transferase
LLLLSASKGKLGTYILPCFVPLSLLLAVGLTQSMVKQDSGPFRIAAWTSAAVAGIAAAVITPMGFLNLTSCPVFESDERWKWVVGSAALVAWCGISIASARDNRKTMKLGLFAAAPIALILSAHFIVPKQTLESRTPEAFIERCAGAIDPEDEIYSTDYLAPAACWVLKRSDIGIIQRGGELQYGLNYPDAKNRQIQISELAKQINNCTRTRGIILMMTDRDYSRYRKYLAEATRIDGADGFIFLKYVGFLETSRKP